MADERKIGEKRKAETQLLRRIQTQTDEQEILDRLLTDSKRSRLMFSVSELAHGITYREPVTTGWKPPVSVRRMSLKKCDSIRKKFRIVVDGADIPPPIPKFHDMRFPDPVLYKLKEQGIVRPTPIQVQGLPAVLSGRDMIGISGTGSGKTLVFVLPMIMMAIQEQVMMPIVQGEGPFGLVICPSRELARQIHDVVEQFLLPFKTRSIRTLLCTGGIDMRSQSRDLKEGVHMVIATPGRLKDLLTRKMMNLNSCRYLALDEADALLDGDFEDIMSDVFNFFKFQRQTLLFSATMPPKTEIFARRSLVNPVTVNVMGRAGAANLDVIQHVVYVKQEAKFVQLLESLQKTPPPVLVFCENKADVDQIHTYLVIKGVDAAGIHGSMDEEERRHAVSSFRAGKKDVLVATDVVSKGLDFPNIRHVINYDMPESIDNYVHKIGRTGRNGKTGLATTFINSKQSEKTLLDLKHVLQEANQSIPAVLAELSDTMEDVEVNGVRGCAYCGGLGHRIHDCPKLERHNAAQMATYFRFGSGDICRGEI